MNLVRIDETAYPCVRPRVLIAARPSSGVLYSEPIGGIGNVKVSLSVSVLGSAGEGDSVLGSAGEGDSVIGSPGGDSGTISQSELGSESDESRYARPKEAILVARITKIGWK